MNQSKKERTKTVLEQLIQELLTEAPTTYAMMIQAFLPQFRLLLDNAPDERIDHFISLIKQRIDYIENGLEPIGE